MRKKTSTRSLDLHLNGELLDGLADAAACAHVRIDTFAEQLLEAVIPNEDRWDDLTNGGNQLAKLASMYPRMPFVQLLQAALMDYTERALKHGIDAYGFILEPENAAYVSKASPL
jgi:hypothetical protein